MIQAQYKPWFKQLMNWYVGYIKRRDFHKVVLRECPEIDPSKSLLILGNHFSWWDPFLIAYLSIPFKKIHHVMMLEEELAKRKVLTYAGAFGINKKDGRSMIESLSYAKQILKSPQNTLTIFPTGKIESQHVHQYHFENGVQRLLENMNGKVQVIMAIGLVDYFSNQKPTANYFFKEYVWEGNFDVKSAEGRFNEWTKVCLEKEKKGL